MKKFSVKSIASAVCSVLCAAAVCFSAAACNTPSVTGDVYIVSIQQTDDGYTVLYSDGTTQTVGVAGDDEYAAIKRIWEDYVAQTGKDITFAEFIEQCLNVLTGSERVVMTDLLSCVSVYAEFIAPEETEEGETSEGAESSSSSQVLQVGGSGVIYKITDDSVYIVTNYHVIYNDKAEEDKNGGSKIGRNIHCYLYGSEYEPTVIGYDEQGYRIFEYGSSGIECEYIGGARGCDIAVLRADREDVFAVNEAVRAVTLADEYYVGQPVYAIGNAGGEGISVTKGIVSVDSEYIDLDVDGDGKKESNLRSVRFDAAIYHGNSGGGLFNEWGQLIGVNNAGYEEYENLCYAIPGSIVKGAAENIIYHYSDGDEETSGVYKPELGARLSDRNSRFVLTENGYGKIVEDICVNILQSGSVAEQAGLKRGDTITAVVVNGRTFTLERTFEIDDIFLTLRPGDRLRFIRQRDGAEGSGEEITLTSEMFSKVV